MFKTLRQFLLAISYLTCLPTTLILNLPPVRAARTSESLAETPPLSGLAVYLASVGLLIGLLLCFVSIILTHFGASDLLRGTLLTICWLGLTNGLHFDGLMDTADGIFSHRDQGKTIEIMSDPRAGNFAVMVGLSVLLIKASCLASLPVSKLGAVLILTPAWARWAESFAIGKFSYLKEAGKGKIWHDTMHFPRDLYIGAIAPTAVLACIAQRGLSDALLISAATAMAGVTTAFWINHKLAGQTGDTYGAVVELAETGGLLMFTLGCNCLFS